MIIHSIFATFADASSAGAEVHYETTLGNLRFWIIMGWISFACIVALIVITIIDKHKIKNLEIELARLQRKEGAEKKNASKQAELAKALSRSFC